MRHTVPTCLFLVILVEISYYSKSEKYVRILQQQKIIV